VGRADSEKQAIRRDGKIVEESWYAMATVRYDGRQEVQGAQSPLPENSDNLEE